MGKQNHTAEQIIAKVHEADVQYHQQMMIAEIVRQLGICEITYYKWRK